MSELFWAHDAARMEQQDRECEAAAHRETAEIGKLEKLMASDFEAFHRFGGSDRLMQLKTRGK